MTLKSEQQAPLISVCIPVYNGARYIRECILSVLSQSERDFELLISDNCSNDNTLKICGEFVDSRIRVLKSSCNIGSIGNFNKCIENANGELFIMLPCDDLLEEDCLRLLSSRFIDNPSVGIAFGSVLQIDDQGRKVRTNLTDCAGRVLLCNDGLRLIAEKFNPIQHPMVRLKFILEIGGFDKSFGCFCDIHLWSKVSLAGWNASVVGQPLTSLRFYEGQGQSLFRQNTKQNLKKLNDHYGYSLPKDFLRNNHANLLFFKFIRFLNNGCNEVSNERDYIEKIMLARLVKAHLNNLYRSFRSCNFSSVRDEVLLSGKLMKHYGVFAIFRSYLALVMSSLKKVFLFDNKIEHNFS